MKAKKYSTTEKADRDSEIVWAVARQVRQDCPVILCSPEIGWMGARYQNGGSVVVGQWEHAPTTVHNSTVHNSTVHNKHNKIDYSTDFETFWKAYPRRIAKQKAFESWTKAINNGLPAIRLVEGAERYAKYCTVQKTEEKFIKHPATWLNQGCWDDELTIERPEDKDLFDE